MLFSTKLTLIYTESYTRPSSYIKNGPLGKQLITVSLRVPPFQVFIKIETTTPHHHNIILVAWGPPSPHSIKLNFDGSVCGSSAAASIILRDSAGDLIKASALNLESSPVFIVEGMALHHGIILALQNNIQHIIIEGDNLMIINSITEKWEVCHIYREANRVADWITNVGHLIENQFSIEDCTHSTLHNILVTYKVVAPTVRRVS